MATDESGQLPHNHPLFLRDSDAPSTSLISLKLTGLENYALWSRTMRVALLLKNKLSTVASELVPSIMYASSLNEAWDEFKERFDKDNLTRIYQLWTEIASLKQGTESVTSYFSKMKNLWDELDILAPLPSCDCEESGPMWSIKYSSQKSATRKLSHRRTVQTFGKLLEKTSLGERSAGHSELTGSSNLTGIMSLLSNVSNVYVYDWIIDLWASHHITFYKNVFDSIRPIEGQSSYRVQIPIGDKFEITHAGEATILENQKIKNVLDVSDFKFNLLSVSKLTRDLCCYAYFFPDFCVFQGLYSGKMVGIGKEDSGLYILSRGDVVAAGSFHRDGVTTTLWHQRLVHASTNAMKHRHILDVARALKIQRSMPIRFWGECIKTEVYLINKIPTEVLDKKSPYELLYRKQPRIDHLRVFGCLCYGSTLPRGDKFASRARRAVMIGYSKTQKRYKLFDLESNIFFVSRDVSFREDIFPFQGEETCQKDLFTLNSVGMATSKPREDAESILVTTQEDSSSTSMDEEEVPANLPQPSHTITDSPAANLDELAGADVDMQN
ncbi:uncharacterized protein [Nicotiana tomentosiformis]|uniref:uncharacterized protein n=1 Tax=Nicotiana tomentosiformis TaxID=4098 RepID=UPI00388C6068